MVARVEMCDPRSLICAEAGAPVLLRGRFNAGDEEGAREGVSNWKALFLTDYTYCNHRHSLPIPPDRSRSHQSLWGLGFVNVLGHPSS